MTINRIRYKLNTMLNTYKRNLSNLEIRQKANQMMAEEAIRDGDIVKANRYIGRLKEIQEEMYKLTDILGQIEDCFNKLDMITA